MRFIIFGVLVAAVIVPASAADKRFMTVDDLSLLKTVSAPAIDPAETGLPTALARSMPRAIRPSATSG